MEESNLIFFPDGKSLVFGSHPYSTESAYWRYIVNPSQKKKWFCILPQVNRCYRNKDLSYNPQLHSSNSNANLLDQIGQLYCSHANHVDEDFTNVQKTISFGSTTRSIYTVYPNTKLNFHHKVNVFDGEMEKFSDETVTAIDCFQKVLIWNKEPMNMYDIIQPDKVQKIHYTFLIIKSKLLPTDIVKSEWKICPSW